MNYGTNCFIISIIDDRAHHIKLSPYEVDNLSDAIVGELNRGLKYL